MDRNKRISVPLRGIVKDKPQLQSEDGSCEEVINLRYEDNAWRGVGMKKLHNYSLVTVNMYSEVIQPSMLDDNMFVGFCEDDNSVYLISASGRWTSSETVIYALASGEVFKSFAWMNNTLLVYTDKKVAALQYINETGFIQLPDINDNVLPSPRIAVGDENEGVENYTEITSEWYGDTGAELTQDIFNQIIADFLPKYYEKQNLGYMVGYMNFMLAFKLFDGNYILHQGPYPLNIDVSSPTIYNQGVVPNVEFRLSALVSRPAIYYYFHQDIRDAIKTWFDAGLIQSLSIFMTAPQVPYNLFEEDVTKWISHEAPKDFTGVDKLPEEPSYYHIGDIKVEDIVNSPIDEPGKYTVILDKGSLQAIETLEVLPVDNFSHHDLLPEQTYAFNSRLHLGDITTIPGKIPWPFSDWFDSASAPEEIGCFYPRCDAIMSLDYYGGSIAVFDKGIFENSSYSLQIAVTIDVDGRKFVSIREIDIDSLRLWADGLCFRSLVSYPDLRATKIEFLISYSGDLDSPRLLGHYDLVKHPFHNFAYYKSTDELWYRPSFITLPSSYSAFLLLPKWDNKFKETFSEPNRIQTSEVNNLFFYPSKQSYRVGNADYSVRAMIVAQEPMTEMQFGQFPLYVFTSGGVYALEYGNGGEVLYSRITQFLTDVISEGAKPVALAGGAIVYQEMSAVKVLIGRESKDISRQVVAESRNPLYDNVSLIGITTDNTITHVRGKMDSEDMALVVIEFLANSNIGFDSKRQEVLFSSSIPSDNFYTLVYQLRSGAWYKRTEVIDGYLRARGGDLAMIRSVEEESGLNRIDLYSLYDEVHIDEGDESTMQYPWIFLQTRPMQLDTKLHKRIFDAVFRFAGSNISEESATVTVRRPLFGLLYNWDALIRRVVEVYVINYGLLYNWYAATDARKITSSDTWVVPTLGQFTTFKNYLSTNGGGKIKETGLTSWNEPNTGAINSVNFNARGAGWRDRSNGTFGDIKIVLWLLVSDFNAGTNYKQCPYVIHNSAAIDLTLYRYKKHGTAIRLMRPATSSEQLLADGTACANYIGNDGKVYPTVKIGTQVWLAANLAETKFRDDSWIHGFDGGVYTPIDNATWAALTTGALCAYNDDISNI